MAQLFEFLMLCCFGASWPFNIVKDLRARTAKGKSLLFQIFIMIGYICGLAGKFISGNVTYVVIIYVLDLAMVTTDFALTLRNRRLDRLAEQKG